MKYGAPADKRQSYQSSVVSRQDAAATPPAPPLSPATQEQPHPEGLATPPRRLTTDDRRLEAYPLVLTNLARVRCVVIGGGAVAERKVEELLEGGARPLVISPELTERLALWRAKGTIDCRQRPYQPGDLAGAFLAIAAAGDRSVNQAAALEGGELGILVNVCDDPAAGNFHTVATVRRADLLLTVSTGGASPALAARIRRELAEAYGPGYKRLLPLLRALRQAYAGQIEAGRRQEFWRELLAAPLLEWLEGDTEEHIWALAGSLCQRLNA